MRFELAQVMRADDATSANYAKETGNIVARDIAYNRKKRVQYTAKQRAPDLQRTGYRPMNPPDRQWAENR